MIRREFLEKAWRVLSGLMGFVLAVPGLAYLLDPLRKARAQSSFTRVSTLTGLAFGRPTRVSVLAERVDSYTRHPSGPIGGVWLLREDKPDGEPTVRCWQVICPHLGCGIDYIPQRDAFACPCHASEFDRAGKRRLGPAPRDMDELECRVTQAEPSGERWVEVRYEEFRTGKRERQVST